LAEFSIRKSIGEINRGLSPIVSITNNWGDHVPPVIENDLDDDHVVACAMIGSGGFSIHKRIEEKIALLEEL